MAEKNLKSLPIFKDACHTEATNFENNLFFNNN